MKKPRWRRRNDAFTAGSTPFLRVSRADDATSCILCGGCVDVCPWRCLELVSLDRVAFDETTTGQLAEMRHLLGVELDDIKAEELGVVIAGSASC